MTLSTLLFFLGAVIAVRVAWRRGARAFAAGAVALAVLFGSSLWQTTHPALLAVLIVLAVAVVWHRWGATSATVTRWGATIRRKSGVASSWDVARQAGGAAMRRRAPTMRPSLRPANWRARAWQLATLPPAEVAVRLCRVGRQTVWCAMELVVIVIGGPRMGKSQLLSGQIIDHPGAVIVTSTRTDLLDEAGPLREQRGPVLVFNPVGLGERPSTVTFDPLTGCGDPVTAAERATDMLAGAGHSYRGSGSADREFWDDQGRRNLAALLHAAALAGDLSIAVVGRWLAHLDESHTQIAGLLRNRSPEPAFEASVTQFIETNGKTRSSITATISPALAWLHHRPAQQAALAARDGGRPLDIERLLAERGSVFMLGGEESHVAPLVCGMTGWIAREARRLAALAPGGRLDPPLGLRLDECALICPIPLHDWTADMGGRGVSIVACFQSRSQLIDHYGEAKASTIMNNAGCKVLFGGTGDRDDLHFWSTLAGERDEPITTTDLHGRVASRTTRRVPVLAPAQIATLPPGRVVVFTSAMPPVIGRAEKAYRRRDVRAHHAPNALTVRAHAWIRRAGGRLARWAGREATPLLATVVGLWIGAVAGAETAVSIGQAPGWAGALAGGLLGATAGLLAGRLLALAWQHWRRPIARWIARSSGPARVWVTSRWSAVRARVTGRDGTGGYRAFGLPAATGAANAPGPWAAPAVADGMAGESELAGFGDDPEPATDPFMQPVSPWAPALPDVDEFGRPAPDGGTDEESSDAATPDGAESPPASGVWRGAVPSPTVLPRPVTQAATPDQPLAEPDTPPLAGRR